MENQQNIPLFKEKEERHDLIENKLIIISKQTFDIMLKQEKPSDLIALYNFYIYTAKWQDTNRPKASTHYVSGGLHWDKSKVRKNKRKLIKMGLIEEIRDIDKNTGKVKGYYIKVKYLWRTDLEAKTRGRETLPEDFAPQNALQSNNKMLYTKNFIILFRKNQQK